ncbi:MAG: hypothetical protein HYZ53_27205 [Planctomycetes bacterium]|nr:hypothetical protein [Planctomycetota bacterium]
MSPAGFYDKLEAAGEGLYKITDRHGTVATFTLIGGVYRLTDKTDRHANHLVLTYTGERLTAVTDSMSRTVNLEYREDGKLLRLRDFYDPANPRTVEFAYTAEGDLLSSTDPLGFTRSYTYATNQPHAWQNHNLLTCADAEQHVYVSVTYDEDSDRVLAEQYGTGAQVYHFAYGHQTLEGDGWVRMTDRRGDGTWSYRRDATGHVVERRVAGEGLTAASTANFNADGERIFLQKPLLNTETWTFDATNADPLRRGDKLEHRRIAPFQVEPDRVEQWTPVVGVPWSLAKTYTNIHGRVTTFYYDFEEAQAGDLNGDGLTGGNAGDLVKITHPMVTLGQPTPQVIEEKFWWDGQGRRLRSIDPTGKATAFEYFASGPEAGYRKKVIEDPGGLALTTEWTVDKVGNATSEKSPRNITTTFEVNRLNLVKKILGALGYETRIEYDGNRRMTQRKVKNLDGDGVQDPQLPWIVTDYTHTLLGDLATEAQSVTATTTRTLVHSYDANQNRIATAYPSGRHDEQVHDARRLLVRSIRGAGSPRPEMREFLYDGNANRTAEVWAAGSRQRAFDVPDRVKSGPFPDLGGWSITYAPDGVADNGDCCKCSSPGRQAPSLADGMMDLSDMSGVGAIPDSDLGSGLGFGNWGGGGDGSGAWFWDAGDESGGGGGGGSSGGSGSDLLGNFGDLLGGGDFGGGLFGLPGFGGGASGAGGGGASGGGGGAFGAGGGGGDGSGDSGGSLPVSGGEYVAGYEDGEGFCGEVLDTLHQVSTDHDEAGRAFRTRSLHQGSDQQPIAGGESTTTMLLDAAGRMNKLTPPTGVPTMFLHDTAGRRWRTTDKQSPGNEETLTLDEAGNATHVERALHNSATGQDEVYKEDRVFDAYNRATSTTLDPGAGGANLTTTVKYDSRSHAVEVTDPKGNKVKRTFDGLGHERTVTYQPATGTSITLTSDYDADGLLHVLTDGMGNQTTYLRDETGRVKRTTYADASFEAVEFDADGRQTQRTDRNGTIVTTSYNAMGLPRRRVIALAAGVVGPSLEEIDYNALNLPTRVTSETGETQFDYTSLDQVDKITYVVADVPGPNKTTTFGFDAAGHRTRITYPGGRVVEQDWDDRNRLWKIREGATVLAQFDYAGQAIARRTYSNGITLNVTRDSVGRPVDWRHTDGTGAVRAGFAYAWDADSLPKYRGRIHDGLADVYDYDGHSQLVGVKEGVPFADLAPNKEYGDYPTFAHERVYAFDNTGSRKTVTEDGVASAYNHVNGIYVADALDRYRTIDAVTRGHDANGNVTDDGTFLFSYNYRNQLAEARRKSDNKLVARYLYDAAGQRVRKVKFVDGVASGWTDVFQEEQRIIAEGDETGAVVATYTNGSGIDDVLAMDRGGQRSWLSNDRLGSIILATSTSGLNLEKYDYEEYGKPMFSSWDAQAQTWVLASESALLTQRLFAGREHESGLSSYDSRARTYHPGSGRFTSVDPLGSRPDRLLNVYTYCNNAPTLITDPTGLDTHLAWGAPRVGENWRSESEINFYFRNGVQRPCYCLETDIGINVRLMNYWEVKTITPDRLPDGRQDSRGDWSGFNVHKEFTRCIDEKGYPQSGEWSPTTTTQLFGRYAERGFGTWYSW